jgi:hypothetical protein
VVSAADPYYRNLGFLDHNNNNNNNNNSALNTCDLILPTLEVSFKLTYFAISNSCTCTINSQTRYTTRNKRSSLH